MHTIQSFILNIRPFVISLFIGTGSAAFAAQPVNLYDINEAKSVLQQYFNALSAGDTQEIITFLGGKLLEQQQERLSNPNYSLFLQKLYSESQLKILTAKLSGDEIQIDANLIKNSQEFKSVRFHIIKNINTGDAKNKFRIHRESALN